MSEMNTPAAAAFFAAADSLTIETWQIRIPPGLCLPSFPAEGLLMHHASLAFNIAGKEGWSPVVRI